MHIIPEISITLYGGWMLVLIYFVIDISLLLMMPKYNLARFVKVPKIKYVTPLNRILYYLQLILLLILPLKTGTTIFYIGIILFTFGVLMFSVAMLFFAISEVQYKVTKGIYAIIKHPVYVSFFILMIGASLSVNSALLLILSILHFMIVILLIKAENKECENLYS